MHNVVLCLRHRQIHGTRLDDHSRWIQLLLRRTLDDIIGAFD